MAEETENEQKQSPAGCTLNEILPNYRVKLKCCSLHKRRNENGENDSTYLSDILHGTFESETLKVFIRKFEKERIHKDQFELDLKAIRDLAALRQRPNLHENFIRYFAMEEDANFIYVITEWCICSVEDLYDNTNINRTNWIGENISVKEIEQSLGPKQILWQATKGLEYLHHEGYVHRNLKPSNFLIAKIGNRDEPDEYKVKLSDFRLSKNPKECPMVTNLKGSNGWVAPSSGIGKTKAECDYFADDVFVLGCFFYYVLTNGLHPFGNNLQRIGSNSDPVYCAGWNPSLEKQNEQANFLLKQMIKFVSKERCSLIQVLDSHYFLPDEDYYKLYDIPDGVKPGLCVIFNQEIFDDPTSNRDGTERDKTKLTIVFKALGFDVEIFENLKKKDLLYYIEDLTSRDNFSTYASLIVCILSHGDENVVEGTDGKSLNINELKYKFNSNACLSLNGKPKIWIIQACQGTENQPPLRQSSDRRSASRSNFSTDDNHPSGPTQGFQISYEQKITFERTSTTKTEGNGSAQENLNNRAPFMDFLDIRASIPGFHAYRSADGSILIKYLCDEMEKEYLSEKTSPNKESKDLEGILNSVQDIISKETMTSKTEFVKQTIVRNVSLNRRIKFKKSHLPGKVTLRQNDSRDEVLDIEKSINIVIGQTFLIYLLFGGITLSALSTDNYILSVYNRMPVIQFIYFFLLFQFSLILLKTFKNLCVLLDDGWLEKKNSLAMTLC